VTLHTGSARIGPICTPQGSASREWTTMGSAREIYNRAVECYNAHNVEGCKPSGARTALLFARRWEHMRAQRHRELLSACCG
jgi:hypothetical protein